MSSGTPYSYLLWFVSASSSWNASQVSTGKGEWGRCLINPGSITGERCYCSSRVYCAMAADCCEITGGGSTVGAYSCIQPCADCAGALWTVKHTRFLKLHSWSLLEGRFPSDDFSRYTENVGARKAYSTMIKNTNTSVIVSKISPSFILRASVLRFPST